jgi:hypothetical protein
MIRLSEEEKQQFSGLMDIYEKTTGENMRDRIRKLLLELDPDADPHSYPDEELADALIKAMTEAGRRSILLTAPSQ